MTPKSAPSSSHECLLRLDYACSKEELEEAESLALRHQIGGGSRWLTWAILLLVLTGMLLALWVTISTEIPPTYRPLLILGFVLIWIFVFLKQRAARRGGGAPVALEISEVGVRVVGGGANVTTTWRHFARVYESPRLFVLADETKTALLVIPKRAFPDERWQDCFRAQTLRVGQESAAVASEVTQQTPVIGNDVIRLEFRYRFRDYLDRALANWFVRGIMILFACVFFGTLIYAAAHPSPQAVYSPLQVFFFFGLPFVLLMVSMVPLLAAAREWFASSSVGEISITLGADGMMIRGMGSEASTGWEVYTRFKETPWSFVLWRPSDGAWMLLPKRHLGDDSAVSRCRELLKDRSTESTWMIW